MHWIHSKCQNMPTPSQAKRAYIKKLNQIARRYGRMENQTAKRAVTMLRALRRDIAAEIGTTEWSQHRARELMAGLDRLVARFQAQLTGEFQAAMNTAIADGGASVTDPMHAAGISVSFHQPSTAQVNVALDFSADLIRDIGVDIRQKVNKQIRLAMLGGLGPHDAMKAITYDMGLERAGTKDKWGRKKRIVKGIRYGAERVLRTELQRGFNLAAYSQQQAIAEQEPELRKRWIASADSRTRDSHIAAHIRYMNEPIPIDEPFVVGGAKLDFPGDPAGPPDQVINCRCRSVTIHPLIGLIGTPLDARVKTERKRRRDEST